MRCGSGLNSIIFGLALGMPLILYSSVAKELKLKVRKIVGVVLTFGEVRGEKMVGRSLFSPPPPILNRVK